MIPAVRAVSGELALASLAARRLRLDRRRAVDLRRRVSSRAAVDVQYQIHAPADETISELAIPVFVSVPVGLAAELRRRDGVRARAA